MMIGRALSHYKILKELGRGGMGQVYLAQDIQLDRSVALKILPAEVAADKDRMRRFIQEAKATSALNHPNIGHIYEISEADGVHFIAMEFVDGETLASLMSKDPLDVQKIIDVALQASDALDEAHAKGIIHRDIKPANIMVTTKGLVKVLDFGLAKINPTSAADGASEVGTLTSTEPGVVLGTVQYMSPEQCLGRKVDNRSDIFSLGIVVYEMATNRRPFKGNTVTETVEQIIHAQPQAISQLNYNVPPEMDRIIRKCMEKDPERRYQSAHELLIDLKNLKRDKETPSAFAPVRKQTKLSSAVVLACIIAMILVATAAFFLAPRFLKFQTPNSRQVSIAVLPFQILTAKEEIGYLSIGIPDSIITRLASIKQLRLRPTSSIIGFQNRPIDLEEVRRLLKVDHVLNGVVQKAEDRFRVSVQLIRLSDGDVLWGEHYDLKRDELLTLEDKIAEKISMALPIQLSANERERLYRRYTQNAAAYELYLKGRSALRQYTKEGTLDAVKSFEDALSLDQNYALARAGLALACAEMSLRYAGQNEVKNWGERAEKEAMRALQLSPDLGEAHEALAAIYRKKEFDWPRTIQESKKALDLNPTLELPHYYIGAAYYHLGLLDKATEEAQKGLQLGGQYKTEGIRIEGISALFSGNFVNAIKNFEEVQRLSSKPISDTYLAYAYYYHGEKDRAERVLQELIRSTSASAAARAKATLASFLAARAERAEAEKLIASVINDQYMDHHVALGLAQAFAQMQQFEKAMSWLREAAKTGLPCYPLYVNDPLLSPLRNVPKFREFLEELKRQQEEAGSSYE